MSYRLWCEELLFQQDSEGWVITVIHDPAIPAYTTFHIALQWNQISPSIFSDNISAWGCLSFNPLSRGPSTEVLELEGNVSSSFFYILAGQACLSISNADQTLQTSVSNDGNVTTLLKRLYLCPMLGLGFKLCNHRSMYAQRHAQTTLLLLQPGHCFHHILLKSKNKCWQFLNSSSCRMVFSKICKLVSFILMLEMYIKIIWITNNSCVNDAFERASQIFFHSICACRCPTSQ